MLSSFSVTGVGSWMSSNGAREGGQMSYFGVDVDTSAQSVTLNLANPMVSVDGPWELTFPTGGK